MTAPDQVCGVEYSAADDPRSVAPKCTRPSGHRDDSVSCYSDAAGCHTDGHLWWTNKHTSHTNGDAGV